MCGRADKLISAAKLPSVLSGMKYWLLVLLFLPGLALAGDAANCIQVGATDAGQYLRNTCSEEITVFWCHDHDKQGYRSGLCGATEGSGRFYRLSTLLKPGATEDNRYSLPAHARITYGACFGGYGSYKYADDEGGYFCKPSNPAAAGGAVWTMTAAAREVEEACLRARVMAMEQGTPGECDCQARGNTSICRVQASGARPDRKVIDAARRWLHEYIKCKPEEEECRRQRRVSIGAIRG